MAGDRIAANYCPEGCYWPCDHRTPGSPGASEGRWELGPDTGDDPEQQALDEWRLFSFAGAPMTPGIPTVSYCHDCGRSFTDPTEHAREHERTRQLGGDA